MATKTKTGHKTRKYGRKLRSPAQQRYTSERRWIKNKRRKTEKREKKLQKLRDKRAA